jgi:hypothetical protein
MGDKRGGLLRISASCRSCCEGHRCVKPVSATKRGENGTRFRSIIRRGAIHAFVRASAVRSYRGVRDSCALCSVPSRSLSVARPQKVPRNKERSASRAPPPQPGSTQHHKRKTYSDVTSGLRAQSRRRWSTLVACSVGPIDCSSGSDHVST